MLQRVHFVHSPRRLRLLNSVCDVKEWTPGAAKYYVIYAESKHPNGVRSLVTVNTRQMVIVPKYFIAEEDVSCGVILLLMIIHRQVRTP